MITIRLSRSGSKNNLFYKIVAIDSIKKTNGKPIEYLGYWQPSKKMTKINRKSIEKWVREGAQVSKAVEKLIS